MKIFYETIFAIWLFVRQYSDETQGRLWNAIFKWAFDGILLDETELDVEKDAYALYLSATTIIPQRNNKKEM